MKATKRMRPIAAAATMMSRVRTIRQLPAADDGQGVVIVMLHVVFARPNHLDRGVYGHREQNRFIHVIHFQAPAETTAHQCDVDGDRVPGQAGDGDSSVLGILWVLGGHPYGAAIGAYIGRAIKRLHGGVSQIRHFVNGR